VPVHRGAEPSNFAALTPYKFADRWVCASREND